MTSGLQDIRTSGHQDFRTSGLQNIRTSAFRTSGLQDFRTSGHLDIRTSGLQDFRTSGHQDFRTSGHQKIPEWGRLHGTDWFWPIFTKTGNFLGKCRFPAGNFQVPTFLFSCQEMCHSKFYPFLHLETLFLSWPTFLTLYLIFPLFIFLLWYILHIPIQCHIKSHRYIVFSSLQNCNKWKFCQNTISH